MIVRFHLERDMVLVVEANDAGMVFKHTCAPIFLAVLPPRITNFARRVKNRLREHVFKEVLNDAAAVCIHRPTVRDPPSQRFVAAVFAPGLGQRFQFRICRVALDATKIRPNALQLLQR